MNISYGLEPVVTLWKQSTTSGYGGIRADVDKIQYSQYFVYIHTSGIPSYSIGPWQANPNIPKNMDATYKFPRYPQIAPTKTAVGLGHIGMFINGVAMFNADDAQSYNNQGIWKRNAYYFEGISFDVNTFLFIFYSFRIKVGTCFFFEYSSYIFSKKKSLI